MEVKVKTYWVWWNKEREGKRWFVCEVQFARTNEPVTSAPIPVDKVRAHSGDCVSFETIVTPSGKGVFSFVGSVQYIHHGDELIAIAS